jgi:hypothetical protein
MLYTPTGRPVGRPKTKDYRTISLKIPQDLVARVQAYARTHRQSISELIRDGLEWRITEGDPRSAGGTVPQGSAQDAAAYSWNTEMPASQEPAVYSWNTEIPAFVRDSAALSGVLQAILATEARQEAQIHALAQALAHRAEAPTPFEYSGNTTSLPEGPPRAHAATQAAETRQTPHATQAESGNTVVQDTEPAFDAARFLLGPLCQKQHNYDGQGHSLRQRGGKHECVACKNARSRAYKERQRQAKTPGVPHAPTDVA